jgi:endonuclease/exonuclease/phosphatase family metal-dependent hydrolase
MVFASDTPMPDDLTGPATGLTARVKCMTYNIHSGVGLDKRYDLTRIRRVLASEQPQIVALQELDCGLSRSAHDDQSSSLADGLAATSSFCPARQVEQGSAGLAVISPFSVIHEQHYDLSHRSDREPRYCQRVDLRVAEGAVLHVFNCHLGLAARERAFQRNRMLSDAVLLSEDLHHPVLLMGDFNDSPISVVHRSLRKHFADAFSAAGKRWGPTFRLGPVPFRLDHIYCGGRIRVLDCWVPNDDLTRVASDHRPVVAVLEVTWPSSSADTPAGRA